MTAIQKQILKKIETIPEVYLHEILDFVVFIEQKKKKNQHTGYLSGIKGMKQSIKKSRKEKIIDCKTLEDIGWR